MCLFDLRFGFYDTQNDVAKLDKCAKCTVPAICGNTCFWLLHHCGMHSMVACGLLSWRVSPKNEKTVNLLHLVISTRRRSGNREPIGGIGTGTGSDFYSRVPLYITVNHNKTQKQSSVRVVVGFRF